MSKETMKMQIYIEIGPSNNVDIFKEIVRSDEVE